jgi:hypothetical protein
MSVDCGDYEAGGLCLSRAYSDSPCENGNFCCGERDRYGNIGECDDVCWIYQDIKKQEERNIGDRRV